MDPIQIIADMGIYHWLSLAVVLLIAEVSLPGGFFLGAAAGALFTGLLQVLVGDFSWQWAISCYSLSAVAFSYIAVTRLRGLLDFQSDHEQLNDRMSSLLGAQGVIMQMPGQATKVKIGDTLWGVVRNDDLEHHSKVTVVGVSGTDTICKCNSSES